jgi:O-antigen/teichoic acid export membrane protein
MAQATVSGAGRLTGLRDHLRDPMHRDGYALVAGSAITSGLGMVFWLVAAHLYAPAQIGVASAMIAAMGFLANLATLGLRNGLIRFLPVTDDPVRLIRRAYLGCALTATVAAGVFLVGQPFWAPRLGIVRATGASAALFTAATVVWLLFVLQDAVLTGIRQARWVPVENGLYAVSKLGLLLIVAVASPWGVFVAWIVPALALLIPVNVGVFRDLGRRGGRGAHPQPLGSLIRFAAADHSSSLLWLGTTELVPLLVLGTAGPEAGAVYYLAFTIAYSLYLVTSNVSSALVIEASLHPERESVLIRRAILQAGRLVVPAALAGWVMAPFLLRLLGEHYEQTGVTLLRLLLLSAIPQVVVGVALGRARVRQRLGVVVAVYATVATTVVVGTLIGLPRFGLDAVGWTWLAVQTVLALVLLRGTVRVAPTPKAWLLAAGFRARSAPRAFRRGRVAPERVSAALETAGLQPATAVRTLRSDNDVLVVAAENADHALIVKVATAPAGDRSVERNAAEITRIRSDPRCGQWLGHLPRVLAIVGVQGRRASVETRLMGQPADRLSGDRRTQALAQAWDTLAELHGATACRRRADDVWLRSIVDAPVQALGGVVGAGRRADALAALRLELRTALTERELTVCAVHGDAWAGNVLVSPVGEDTGSVSFADWEDGRADGLGEVDLAHLHLSEQPGELGRAVIRALHRPQDWPGGVVQDGVAVMGPGGLPVRVVVLLAWLGHVAAGIGRTTELKPGARWVRSNVLDVLDILDARAPEPEPQPTSRSARKRDVGGVLLLGAAVALWVLGLWGEDPRSMTGLGLISLFDAPMVAALLIIVSGFLGAWRRNAPGWLLGAHLVVFVAVIHGTPAVFYDTLRYSWAWKHVGIVDFILRTGTVDPGIGNASAIYHSWPGFFAGTALLTELVGAKDAVGLATWAPVAFNLANLVALRYLLRALTADRRMVWLALWIFSISNWIGQDYFSPQAMAFVLHLTILGVVMRNARRRDAPMLAEPMPTSSAAVLFLLLVTTVASSHQITPVMLAVTLAGLVVTRVIRARWLVGAAVLVGAWAATVGLRIMQGELGSIADDLFRPVANAEETFSKTRSTLPEQVLVSLAGRGVVLLVGLLAVIGVIRLWRRGALDRSVLVMGAAPAVVPLATSFGGEVIFRVYLFALPALSLLAAGALVGDPHLAGGGRPGRRVRAHLRHIAVAVVSLLLLTGFLFAYYGKDQQYAFTDEEVAAALWVAADGPSGSLLVVGSRNYPGQSRTYEHFVSVAIDREPADGLDSLLADPAGRLGDWLDDSRYVRSYLLLTRSQRIDVDTNGAMPSGSLTRIEALLRSSTRFRVAYENRDAVVFELSDGAGLSDRAGGGAR